ncbi:hypothetical protein [Shewanella sp.]|uniref:hypothetical protein n=1 Tax=Shewanella sp. TaxID=50422 RepID=UPI003564A355
MKTNNLLIFIILLLSWGARAEQWQLNGYISQGLVSVEGSEFFTDKDNTSFALSEATLMASWRQGDNWRLAGAMSYRQRGNLIADHVQADYLFLEYLRPVESGFVGARLGRVKNEVGFYSSTRDVPFARPSILLPQSIYADYYRDTQLHINGGEVLGRHDLESGQFVWHLSGGVLNVTDDLTINTMGTTEYGTLESDYFYSVDLDYSTESWRFGANIYQTVLEYNSELRWAPAEIELSTWVVSVQYRSAGLEITSELSQGTRSLTGASLPGWEREQPFRGYYIDARYQMTADMDVFLRYDYSQENLDDPDGELLELMGVPGYFGYGRDWTVGCRWRLAANWQLAAEYHWVEGAAWVPPILNKNPRDQDRQWSLFAIELSYRMQW